jgi:pSer/pThr/pTyr-binding forkhead associated (FHA) protein
MIQSPLAPHTASPAELKERMEAQRRGTPFLVYRDAGGKQLIFDLAEAGDRVTAGRRPESDVPLPWDLEVSRLHAQFERIGEDWTIADDGLSRNGTFVNGARLDRRQRLRDGDTIRIGKTVIAFCAPADGESKITMRETELPNVGDLTDMQRQVLVALCRPFKDATGFATPATNQDIAGEVYLSVDAVKSHLRSLFGIFGVAHLPQNEKRLRLAERALETGVVSSRDL